MPTVLISTYSAGYTSLIYALLGYVPAEAAAGFTFAWLLGGLVAHLFLSTVGAPR